MGRPKIAAHRGFKQLLIRPAPVPPGACQTPPRPRILRRPRAPFGERLHGGRSGFGGRGPYGGIQPCVFANVLSVSPDSTHPALNFRVDFAFSRGERRYCVQW